MPRMPQNLNDQNKNVSSKWFVAFVLNFEYLNFVFVSDFDIHASQFRIY